MNRQNLLYRGVLLVFFCMQLLFTGKLCAADPSSEDEIFAVATISDINRLVSTVSFYTLLELDVNSGVVLQDKDLIPFANYLDYAVVGAGKTVYMYPGRIASFIARKLETGTKPEEISDLVISEFQSGNFVVDLRSAAADQEQLRVKVGAYLVGEFEYHQEANGDFQPLLELNQAKFFFSGNYAPENKNGANGVNFLAEFNPVPEEVVHQIDEVSFLMNGEQDTIRAAEARGEGLIPFERLQFTVQNLGGSGLHLTLGQIRNPFGIWSDFTSHRNFTATKNNVLVTGSALKRIELGVQLERKLGPVTVMGAVVHGRRGRTSPLYRNNEDNRFDGVFRAAWSRKGITAGASLWLADFRTQTMAAGADITWEAGKMLLGGEFVYQQNQHLVGTDTAVVYAASSLSGYLQADYSLSPKLHLFGMYDIWNCRLDGKQLYLPAIKVFHGLRYYITRNVRWTVVEYGRMFHARYDRGYNHLSTQIEVTF